MDFITTIFLGVNFVKFHKTSISSMLYPCAYMIILNSSSVAVVVGIINWKISIILRDNFSFIVKTCFYSNLAYFRIDRIERTCFVDTVIII